MLRGPQTRSEIRSNAANLKGPADLEGVDAALERLADRAEPLVLELPRGAGQKEARWAHRLCGEDAIEAMTAPPPMQNMRIPA